MSANDLNKAILRAGASTYMLLGTMGQVFGGEFKSHLEYGLAQIIRSGVNEGVFSEDSMIDSIFSDRVSLIQSSITVTEATIAPVRYTIDAATEAQARGKTATYNQLKDASNILVAGMKYCYETIDEFERKYAEAEESLTNLADKLDLL